MNSRHRHSRHSPKLLGNDYFVEAGDYPSDVLSLCAVDNYKTRTETKELKFYLSRHDIVI